MSVLTDSIRMTDFGSVLGGYAVEPASMQVQARRGERLQEEAERLDEERLNAITHGLGFVISVAAVAYMLGYAVTAGGWLRVASCGVYGATLVLMYAASTSLHA